MGMENHTAVQGRRRLSFCRFVAFFCRFVVVALFVKKTTKND
jgi:hypothetical protein